jgi:SAM-dependent methyltransferase
MAILPVFMDYILQQKRDFDIELGNVLTLGKHAVEFDGAVFGELCRKREIAIQGEILTDDFLSDKNVFCALGTQNLMVLDASDYEEAGICFDLNEPVLPEKLCNSTDLILDIGVLEHVFDTRVALRNLHGMLRKNGCIIHIVPALFTLDCAYYGFSPTFFWDYYSLNNYQILNFELRYANDEEWQSYESLNYRGPYYNMPEKALNSLPSNNFLTVRKTDLSTCEVIPQQSMYKQKWRKQQYNENYLSGSMNSKLEEWNREKKRLVLYGGGEHTERLFLWTKLQSGNIVAIVDASTDLQGKSIHGFPVYSPEYLENADFDVIIVSSLTWQDEIYYRLKQQLRERRVEIIRLYR